MDYGLAKRAVALFCKKMPLDLHPVPSFYFVQLAFDGSPVPVADEENACLEFLLSGILVDIVYDRIIVFQELKFHACRNGRHQLPNIVGIGSIGITFHFHLD
jgi:hypothetical protein